MSTLEELRDGIPLVYPNDSSSVTTNTTLSSTGGGASLVGDGMGPTLSIKSITAGADITVVDNGTDIEISSTAGATTLASAGGTETLVNDGTGPALATKGLTAGTGISLVGTATDVTIANTDGASTVSLSSAGGTESLVNDGTGPTLATKGISAGPGIGLVGAATSLTIENTSPASSVALSSTGGTESLVVDGSGPTLSVKGLTAGTNVTLTPSGTDVTINGPATTSLASAGGTETLVQDGTGPALATKGLTAGTGIALVGAANDVTISNTDGASSVALSSTGGTESLVVDGTGPTLSVKGLTAGTNITLTPSGTDITIVGPDTTTLASAGGTETLVQDGTGPTLATKGLTAGTGISLTGAANDVTIVNADPASSVALTSAGGTTLVSDGVGPALAIKGLTGAGGLSIVDNGTNLEITTGAAGVVTSVTGDTSITATPTTGAVALSINTMCTTYVTVPSDFGALVGGRYQLTANMTYLIVEPINIGTDGFDVPDGNVSFVGVFGKSGITCTRAAGDVFQFPSPVTAVPPPTLYMVDMTFTLLTGGEIATVSDGWGSIYLNRVFFITNGKWLMGNNGVFNAGIIYVSNAGVDRVGNPFVQVPTGKTLGTFVMLNAALSGPNTNSNVIQFDAGSTTGNVLIGGTSITAGVGTLTFNDQSTLIAGTTQRVLSNGARGGAAVMNGTQPSLNNITLDAEWNSGVDSSKPGGVLYFSTPAQTNIVAVGAWVKIAGTTTASFLRKVTMPVDNRLTYVGLDPRRFRFDVAISIAIVGGNNDDFEIGIFKNGVLITGSEIGFNIQNANRNRNISNHFYVDMVTNDFLEVFVRNLDAAVDIQANYGHFTLKY